MFLSNSEISIRSPNDCKTSQGCKLSFSCLVAILATSLLTLNFVEMYKAKAKSQSNEIVHSSRSIAVKLTCLYCFKVYINKAASNL